MKRISSTVNYTVPSWNFCNVDHFDIDGELTGQLCRFCIKTRAGHKCLLYDQTLDVNSNLVKKVRACCEATAGYASTIDEAPPTPAISPRELIKQTIDMYNKYVGDLVKQGYPQAMAEAAAKKFMTK